MCIYNIPIRIGNVPRELLKCIDEEMVFVYLQTCILYYYLRDKDMMNKIVVIYVYAMFVEYQMRRKRYDYRVITKCINIFFKMLFRHLKMIKPYSILNTFM